MKSLSPALFHMQLLPCDDPDIAVVTHIALQSIANPVLPTSTAARLYQFWPVDAANKFDLIAEVAEVRETLVPAGRVHLDLPGDHRDQRQRRQA